VISPEFRQLNPDIAPVLVRLGNEVTPFADLEFPQLSNEEFTDIYNSLSSKTILNREIAIQNPYSKPLTLSLSLVAPNKAALDEVLRLSEYSTQEEEVEFTQGSIRRVTSNNSAIEAPLEEYGKAVMITSKMRGSRIISSLPLILQSSLLTPTLAEREAFSSMNIDVWVGEETYRVRSYPDKNENRKKMNLDYSLYSAGDLRREGKIVLLPYSEIVKDWVSVMPHEK
jgi:hypothetical protein